VRRAQLGNSREAQAEKAEGPLSSSGPSKPRQHPTLPQSCPCSTIGPEELNFRVRDGNGCGLFGIAARKKRNEVRSSAGPRASGQSDKHSVERDRTTSKETTTSVAFHGSAIADGLDLLPARLELQRQRHCYRTARSVSLDSPTSELCRAPTLGNNRWSSRTTD
jgi:hypothetical protein